MATTTLKKIIPADIGAVAKAGDTMTGNLIITGENYPSLVLKNNSNNDQVQVVGDLTQNRLEIVQKHKNDNYTDYFFFPDTSSSPASDNAYTMLTTKFPVLVTQGGTGATTPAQARKNLQIGEKIVGAPMYINSQASNTWNVFTTNGSTAWQSPTLETGLYLFSIWLREQGGGPCKVDLMINSSGTGDPIMSEEITNWGTINRTFVVEMTSSWVYLWHKHQGSAHTVDARVGIYRLN